MTPEVHPESHEARTDESSARQRRPATLWTYALLLVVIVGTHVAAHEIVGPNSSQTKFWTVRIALLLAGLLILEIPRRIRRP